MKPNFEKLLNKTNTKYIQTSGTDLNDYTEDGKYFFAYASTPANKPANVESLAGYLEVMTPDSLWTLQRWTVYNTNTVYQRQKVNGAWDNWYVISKDFLKVQTFKESNITVGANTSQGSSFNIALNGYIPIGIIEADTTNGSVCIGKYSIRSDTNMGYITIVNPTNTSRTYDVTIKVLYLKI